MAKCHAAQIGLCAQTRFSEVKEQSQRISVAKAHAASPGFAQIAKSLVDGRLQMKSWLGFRL